MPDSDKQQARQRDSGWYTLPSVDGQSRPVWVSGIGPALASFNRCNTQLTINNWMTCSSARLCVCQQLLHANTTCATCTLTVLVTDITCIVPQDDDTLRGQLILAMHCRRHRQNLSRLQIWHLNAALATQRKCYINREFLGSAHFQAKHPIATRYQKAQNSDRQVAICSSHRRAEILLLTLQTANMIRLWIATYPTGQLGGGWC